MPTAYDVPASALIKELTEYLKVNVPEIKPPTWALFVKTGTFAERVPAQSDWWYMRAAAILRQVYIRGPISVKTLRILYGGRKKRGSAPEHHRPGSGSIIRKILQQLEKADLVRKTKEGRVITEKGQSIIDALSTKILKQSVRENPELIKYLTVKSR
ncbi:MAG: 30S ribosomal protein S19e [Thermoprotei archaeon]|jgi:small subunit ribosomal protein S19e